MSHANNRWGVEINGDELHRQNWLELLKPPFDPYVEEVNAPQGKYLALRSTIFDGLATSTEVHQAAKQLFSTLNVAMSKTADTDPVTGGAVIEFLPDGPPLRYTILEAECLEVRARLGIPRLTVIDAQGNVIEPTPLPSKAQLWMRAAALEPEIGKALRYLKGKPGFVELYKAYEALRKLPNVGISTDEIKRFARTANVEDRHHPDPNIKPHPRPMQLWEARSFIISWVSAAIDDILLKNPKSQ